jgi:DNA polymerase-1
MILTVHDELVFEAPHDEAAAVVDLVRTQMEKAYPLNVPLTVDVGTSTDWNSAKA